MSPCRYDLTVATFVVSLLTAHGVAAPITIVTNLGKYADAQTAAHDEASVNWLDADQTDDTICTECFAAVELQHYLRKMTGRGEDFVIVDDGGKLTGDAIVVGQAQAIADVAELGREGCRIVRTRRQGKEALAVVGGSRIGTLYGVYDLLHRLGCRWFAPGEVHEAIPSHALDALPDLDVTETPKFFTRGFHSWENRGNPDFLLWMARNRLNYWCVEQTPHSLLHKLGVQMSCGGHVAQSMFLNPPSAYPYDHPRFEGDEKRPRDPYPVSESCQGDANKDGRLSYFEAHPEWYAWVKGERIPGVRGGGGTNYCTSNERATTEFMKNFVECLATGQWNGAGVVRFWTLDGGKWCQCEKCKALGIPTDRNLLLVHRLDQEIKKARAEGRINRPIIIRFLAYADVLRPPTRPLPADFDYDTCSATYFPICRCYVHNLNDPKCSRNARYDKHFYGWAIDPKRHYQGQICIGEYYNVSGYKCLPICFMHTMQNDIPYYYSRGARHFHYMHCTTGNWGNKALTNYQMARQLWSPATECEPLWLDYFNRRYGPVASEMRRFYETLEKMLCNVTEIKYGLARRLDRGSKRLFPTTHLRHEKTAFEKDDGPDLVEMLVYARTCRGILDEVQSKLLLDRFTARIAEDERLFTYGERTLQYYHAAARAFAAVRRSEMDKAREARAEVLGLAKLLREDTASTKMASSHANAANAFAATYATGAVTALENVLGPAIPSKVKTFDLKKGELVLIGTDFSGGGAAKYGYHLHVYPGRIRVSDYGNFIYGKGARPHDRMTAWFRMPSVPREPIYFNMIGLLCPQPRGGSIAARVFVNDRVVFAKDAPFPETKLGAHELAVQPSVFEQGLNRIQVRNVQPNGRVGSRPWFGIHQIEMRTRPMTKDPDAKPIETPADLALSYRSEIDHTSQPYRIYLPSAYDGKQRLPLFIALHGTGGDQNKYFDHPAYANGIYKTEAEKRGIIVVCPHGRGTTEYRGIGENDVLTVIQEVCKQFLIDEDRIVCSGQSMGGTGTTYLCCRYPDVFAGGAALGSCYGHLDLVTNLRHVPMLYVQGEKDWRIYAKEGPIPITKRMKELGYNGELWVVPGAGHNTFAKSTERVLDWALKQRRVTHPKRVTFRAYLPIHGRAYWTEIQEIDEIGHLAEIDASIEPGNTVKVSIKNAKRFVIRPDAELLDLSKPVSVAVNGKPAFTGACPDGREIRFSLAGSAWRASVEPSHPRSLTAYRTHKIGKAIDPPTQAGKAETSMGNWMTDMMRDATGADLAIYNRRHYRGVSLKQGEDVYLADLLDWIRPFNRCLSTFEIAGKGLLEILEANVLNDKKKAEFLVQVSGCRYAFDRTKPKGKRIVETDIVADRKYTVVCEGQVTSRETLLLAGGFEKMPHKDLELTNVSAAWRYVVKCGGKIDGKLEGRVRDVTK